MTIEKVYDELYGMIDDLKKHIAAGGGTDVTIVPALESGTKVADYTIGEDEGVIYAPSIGVEQVVESGTKLATISVGAEETDIFAPESSGGIEYSTTPVKIGKYGNEDVYRVWAKATGLTVQSWTNVVSDTSSWGVKDVLNMNVMYIDKHNTPYVYIYPNYIQNVEVRWDTTASTPKIQAHYLTTGSFTGDIVIVVDFTKNTAAKTVSTSKKK